MSAARELDVEVGSKDAAERIEHLGLELDGLDDRCVP